nr:tetratricopeptide repeat protein [uncultured Methanoregula sp.]
MKKVKNINDYLREITEISEKNERSRFIFRGQTDLANEVESSAARRIRISLKVTSILIDSFIKYHERLVEIAKMKGYHRKENIELKDLELIAELQHFSAATFFIDFSRNPLIALWFAVNKNYETDGAVYLLDINDSHKIFQVTYNDIENKSIRTFLSESKIPEMPSVLPLWYWEPSNFNLRIPKQHSIFVFGPPIIPKDYFKIIYVDKDSKKTILKDLEKIYDINEISLFSDLPGFARANSTDTTFHEWEGFDYFLYGVNFVQRKEYKKAIEYLTESIKLDPNDFSVYSLRGITYFNLFTFGNVPKDEALLNLALGDFDKAIEINPDDIQSFIGRGMAFILLKNFKAAIDEFNKALKLCPESPLAYLQRGLANREMNKFEDAINDFSSAIKLEPKQMQHYRSRGITFLQMNQYKLALNDFNKAIDLDPTNPQLFNSRALAKYKMGLCQEAQIDEEMAKKLSET